MEIAVGYVIRCLNWRAIRLNNWLDAEITRINGDMIECTPLRQVDPTGKPITPFVVDRATLNHLVSTGIDEVVRVVASDYTA